MLAPFKFGKAAGTWPCPWPWNCDMCPTPPPRPSCWVKESELSLLKPWIKPRNLLMSKDLFLISIKHMLVSKAWPPDEMKLGNLGMFKSSAKLSKEIFNELSLTPFERIFKSNNLGKKVFNFKRNSSSFIGIRLLVSMEIKNPKS
ncbi:hypothetical protein WICPIJ_004433 [Wickerhamomyces pijperi]|uniref:Uncharacterized protein n=1 Tax=Wickerhamomyces pijperi TaxID=599730 RepID=A0A9P8Q5D7_WICPI|nr:hypothetical protein WICPIJ_004433 [Wickerhamomyces pijperi]